MENGFLLYWLFQRINRLNVLNYESSETCTGKYMES